MKEFESHIQGNLPVVVDFYAEWCRPCTLMTPILQEVQNNLGDRAVVVKLDIDKYPHLMKEYNVYGVPTVAIFKNGKILWRRTGIVPAHEILSELRFHIS